MMCGKQECAVQDVHSKAKGKSHLYVFHTRGFDIWFVTVRKTQSGIQQSEHESGQASIVFRFDTKAESGELIPCECEAIFCALHLICDIIRSVVCQILYPNMFLCHILGVHKREGVIRFSENPHGTVNRFYSWLLYTSHMVHIFIFVKICRYLRWRQVRICRRYPCTKAVAV